MKKLKAIIALPILTLICLLGFIAGILQLIWRRVEKYACVLIDWADIDKE